MDQTSIKGWLGQSTTGQGFAGALTIVAAAMSGQMPWSAAIPALAGALVLIIWPQNRGLSTVASTLATDTEKAIPMLLTAYRTGLQHGAASVQKPSTAIIPAQGVNS